MKLTSSSFDDGGVIPAEYAFCAPDPKTHATLSKNQNPHLAWTEVPMGTKSFTIICHDPDVPSKGDDVNQEGRRVPASLPRVDFFHWVLVDLPASSVGVNVGEFSSSVTPRGKPGPRAPHGARQGINDYTGWFASDKGMAGDYHGYDGPCPPWNDELLHHYDGSGLLTMIVQEFIQWEQFVRCLCIGQEDILVIPYDPRERKYLVEPGYLSAELEARVAEDARTLVRALGYDMNSIEFAIRGGIPYAIDFMNPAPDMDIYSLTPTYFEWTVRAMADMAVRLAKKPRRQSRALKWDAAFTAGR